MNEQKYDLTDRERLNNILVEFTFFAKKVLPQLKTMKKVVESSRSIKHQSIASYKVFVRLADKYEDLNLNTYFDGDVNEMVFNNPQNQEINEQMGHMVDNLKNPFDEMYHWMKGEIYDIQALAQAVG